MAPGEGDDGPGAQRRSAASARQQTLEFHHHGRFVKSMFEESPTTRPVLRAELPLLHEAQLAAAAYLARSRGGTLESYGTERETSAGTLRQAGRLHGAVTSRVSQRPARRNAR